MKSIVLLVSQAGLVCLDWVDRCVDLAMSVWGAVHFVDTCAVLRKEINISYIVYILPPSQHVTNRVVLLSDVSKDGGF